jgi:CHAT domain-containing protein
MTLCGLALTGSGRITAEEVAGLDLSGCEMVVLSACDTSLGVDPKRAGQAMQSLQSALHAAGARRSITSLWKVDDVATLDLMKELYRGLWTAKLPASEALWRAKKKLRDAGEPTKRWAGWVLAGPD